eukprot:scaffold588058_cov29-Prasinocladus_malaysianus.AAC.1
MISILRAENVFFKLPYNLVVTACHPPLDWSEQRQLIGSQSSQSWGRTSRGNDLCQFDKQRRMEFNGAGMSLAVRWWPMHCQGVA